MFDICCKDEMTQHSAQNPVCARRSIRASGFPSPPCAGRPQRLHAVELIVISIHCGGPGFRADPYQRTYELRGPTTTANWNG